MCKTPDKTPPLLAVEVVRTGEACPFTNEKVAFELRQGEVVWLRGASGAGKSFTCLHLAGLAELPDATVRRRQTLAATASLGPPPSLWGHTPDREPGPSLSLRLTPATAPAPEPELRRSLTVALSRCTRSG